MNNFQDLFIRVLLIIDMLRSSRVIRWLKEVRESFSNAMNAASCLWTGDRNCEWPHLADIWLYFGACSPTPLHIYWDSTWGTKLLRHH